MLLTNQKKTDIIYAYTNGSDAEEYPVYVNFREQSRRLKALRKRIGEGRRGVGSAGASALKTFEVRRPAAKLGGTACEIFSSVPRAFGTDFFMFRKSGVLSAENAPLQGERKE